MSKQQPRQDFALDHAGQFGLPHSSFGRRRLARCRALGAPRGRRISYRPEILAAEVRHLRPPELEREADLPTFAGQAGTSRSRRGAFWETQADAPSLTMV